MVEKRDTQRVINRDVNAAQRAAKAMELRAARLTYEEIAQRCGYANASAARRALLRELDRCVVKNAEELRAQEADMLDRLHAECWELAMDKKNRGRFFAVDRLLMISKARRELFGLDAKSGEISQQHYIKQVILVNEPAGVAESDDLAGEQKL